MIGHIYYIIGLLVILSVISVLLKFTKFYSVKEWEEKYKKVVGKVPLRSDYRKIEEYHLSRKIGILYFFEILWIFAGLTTSSWYIFLSLILLPLIIGTIIKPFKFTLIFKILVLLFLIIRLGTYTFLVINHFNLHIDIYDLVLQHFNSF
jgi:hypothetical protein